MPGPSLFVRHQNLGIFNKASSGMDTRTKGLFHNLLSIRGLQKIIGRQYIEGRSQSPVSTSNADHPIKTTSSPTKSLAPEVYSEKVGAGSKTGPDEATNEASRSPAKSHVELNVSNSQACQKLNPAKKKNEEAQPKTSPGIELQQGSAHSKQKPEASLPPDLTETSVATLQSNTFVGPATFSEASTAHSNSKVASNDKKRPKNAPRTYKGVRTSTNVSNESHSIGGGSRFLAGLGSPEIGSERQDQFGERLLGSILITSTQPDPATIRDYNKFVSLLQEMIQDATKGLRSPSHNRFVIELYVARHVDKASSVLKPHIVIRCQSGERQSQIEQAINSIASKKIIQKYGFPIKVVVSAPLGTVEFRAVFSTNSDLTRRFENMDTLKGDTVRTTLDMIGQSVCSAQMLIQGSATQPHAQYWVTLGGIILVHGKPYGLTVAHTLVAVAEGGTSTMLSETEEISSGDTPTIPLGSVACYVLNDSKLRDERFKNSDWALVEVEEQFLRPNMVDIELISEVVTQNELLGVCGTDGTTCWIQSHQLSLDAKGNQQAEMSHSIAMVTIGESVFAARRLDLAKPVRPGVSGSWVIVENKLSGIVIAACDDPPSAYMLPIEDVFESVSLCMGDASVALPSRAYSEVLKLWQDSKEEGPKSIFECPELLLAVALEAKESRSGMPLPHLPSNQKESIFAQLEYMRRRRKLQGSMLLLHPLGVSHNLMDLLLILGENIHISEEFANHIESTIGGYCPKVYTRKYSLVLGLFLKQFLQNNSGISILALLLTLSHAAEAAIFGGILVRLFETFGFPGSIIPAATKFKVIWELCVIANTELNFDIRWPEDSLEWEAEFNHNSLKRPRRRVVPPISGNALDSRVPVASFCDLLLSLQARTLADTSQTLVYRGPYSYWAQFYSVSVMNIRTHTPDLERSLEPQFPQLEPLGENHGYSVIIFHTFHAGFDEEILEVINVSSDGTYQPGHHKHPGQSIFRTRQPRDSRTRELTSRERPKGTGKAGNTIAGESKRVKERVEDIKKQLDLPIRRNPGFSPKTLKKDLKDQKSPKQEMTQSPNREPNIKVKLAKLNNFATPYDRVAINKGRGAHVSPNKEALFRKRSGAP